MNLYAKKRHAFGDADKFETWVSYVFGGTYRTQNIPFTVHPTYITKMKSDKQVMNDGF